MEHSSLTRQELRNALNSLKINKSAGIDEINVNVVNSIFDIIEEPLFHIFDLSLKRGRCPDELKIAKVTPIFKAGDESEVSNYRPISVLPCFSKMLERIMSNKIYKHFADNNILYAKQFGFQEKHSTDHAVLELVNEITNGFNKNLFTLGIFIDLSKAFDTEP